MATQKQAAEEQSPSAERSRGLAKTREGYVVSNRMTKTVVVAITSQKRHADYGKFIKSTTKYMAHDERGECQVGDRVLIVESRPLSKNKRWRVRSVLEKAM